MTSLPYEVSIGNFTGLSTNVDSFIAELRYNISTNYQPVYSNLFVETSATSGLFRCTSAFTAGRNDLKVGVMPLGGTLPGACVPTVERIRGPADLLGNSDCTLTFMGAEYALEEEDGWFYPQGGSPRFSIPVSDPDNPSAVLIITYEPLTGGNLRYIQSATTLAALLKWQGQSILITEMTIIRIGFFESGETSYNFSPSLGESAVIGVIVEPPPPNGYRYATIRFQLEIVRETAQGGEQHVDWVDIGNSSEYASWRHVNLSKECFPWNGIPSKGFGGSAPTTVGRDVFKGVSSCAARVFPEISQGEPVPPPFVTAVAKIVRDSDNYVLCEARKRICIPQVVKMEYDQASINAMIAGFIGDNGVEIIQPIPAGEWPERRAQIASQAQAYYATEGVNVRFVDSTVPVLQPYSVLKMDGVKMSNALGKAPLDLMNVDPSQTGTLFYLGFKHNMATAIRDYKKENGSEPDAVTATDNVALWAHVAAHEVGHMLGLVARGNLLNGYRGSHNKPNPEPKPRYSFNLMDPGDVKESTVYRKMGRDGIVWSFRELNSEYLRFILPQQ